MAYGGATGSEMRPQIAIPVLTVTTVGVLLGGHTEKFTLQTSACPCCVRVLPVIIHKQTTGNTGSTG
jgi:hypothetical protein